MDAVDVITTIEVVGSDRSGFTLLGLWEFDMPTFKLVVAVPSANRIGLIAEHEMKQ